MYGTGHIGSGDHDEDQRVADESERDDDRTHGAVDGGQQGAGRGHQTGNRREIDLHLLLLTDAHIQQSQRFCRFHAQRLGK